MEREKVVKEKQMAIAKEKEEEEEEEEEEAAGARGTGEMKPVAEAVMSFCSLEPAWTL